jgi:membrane-associated phospholipid phosphatase
MKAFIFRHFFAVEIITFIYLLLTTLIILVFMPYMTNAIELLGTKLLTLIFIIFLAYLYSKYKHRLIEPVRYLFLGAMLSIWYPETYEINKIVLNFDYLLAKAEHTLFHFQPALTFSQHYPQHWVSELFNLGYFSYYPIIVGTGIYFYITNKSYFEYFFFSVLFSFFCYYTIYILFPTAGPQYYFPAIGIENVQAGIFPQIGHFFQTHQSIIATTHNDGFFFHLVESAQKAGERPTAAFPSSHVGVSSLIMLLIYNNRNYILLAILSPFYFALVGATVYIQAHYAIDVAAGGVSAVIFYYISREVYLRLMLPNIDKTRVEISVERILSK